MTGAGAKPAAIHATVVAIGEQGVLICGVSGAGKSRLALALLAEAARRGQFARLVGDDRVLVGVTNGRVLARPHPVIAGLIEERGAGLRECVHEPAARIVCVVSPGVDDAPRSPEPADMTRDIAGVSLPRLALRADVGPDEGARRVLSFLGNLDC